MLASRLLHPDAVGRITENGNRIGEFTVGGTIELILFGGLLSGLLAGIVWVLVREWLPDRPAVVGLGAIAIGGPLLVQSDNPDFVILGDPGIDLVLLVALVFLFGAGLSWIDKVTDRNLPASNGTGPMVGYSLAVAVGAPLVVPTFGSFLSREFCFCRQPPIWTGVFLLATTATTITWWVLELRGVASPPTALRRLGRLLTAAAATAGVIQLTDQIITIF